MNLELEVEDGWFIFNDDELVKDYDTENIAPKHYKGDVNRGVSTTCRTDGHKDVLSFTTQNQLLQIKYCNNKNISVKEECISIHHNYDIKDEDSIFEDNIRVSMSDSNSRLNKDKTKFQVQISNNISSRKQHMTFGCNVCDQIFKNKNELDEHVCNFKINDYKEYVCCIFDMDENEKYKFSCDKCKQDNQYETSTYDEFKKHVEIHHSDLKILYLCAKCVEGNAVKKMRDKLKYLKSHVKSVHMEKKFKCKSCDYQSDIKSSLRLHISSIHTKEKAFQCTYCSYKSSQKGDKERHVKAVHLKEKNFECKLCSYKSAFENRLKTHMKNVHLKEKRHNCTLCLFKSGIKGSLKKHIEAIHLIIRNYKCTFCNFSAAQKGNLNSHVKVVHKKEKNYKCTFCSYKAGRSDHIKSHIKMVHNKEKNFKCTLCSYEASQNSSIRFHVKTVHMGQYNFNCKLCDYKTSTKSRLDLHVKIVHLKQKDFKCNFCAFKAGTNQSVKVHIRAVHMKQKDYECSFCSFKSGQSSNLKSHIKAVHKNEKNHA